MNAAVNPLSPRDVTRWPAELSKEHGRAVRRVFSGHEHARNTNDMKALIAARALVWALDRN